MFLILSIILSIVILFSHRIKTSDKNEVLGARIIGIIIIVITYRCLILDWIPIELSLIIFSIGITLIIKPKYIETYVEEEKK